MNKPLTLALVQMKVEKNKEENLIKALAFIEQAAAGGAELVVLPEMFLCPYHHEAFRKFAEPLEGSMALLKISELAKQYGIYVFAGSIPELEDRHIYNTCPILDPNGNLIAKHRKLHLFDIDVPGEMVFKESDTLTAGNQFTMINTPYGKIGAGICFDIRFPEMHRIMALEGVFLLVVPAAFNMVTGPAHWDVLFRARAIDNQIYVAAASPARDPSAGYVAYGHSMVINPWGEIIADAGENEKILYARFKPEEYSRFKTRLPLLQGRRTDIYRLGRLD